MSKHPSLSRYSSSELPETDYPSLEMPSFFYKVRRRVGGRCVVLVGLRVHRMRRVEEDQLLYLLQVFNCECPRVKAHLLPPCLLYVEFAIDQPAHQEDAQLEGRLFRLLRFVQQTFAEFITQTFTEDGLFSPKFEPQAFVQRFRAEVVEKVKEEERLIFGRERG